LQENIRNREGMREERFRLSVLLFHFFLFQVTYLEKKVTELENDNLTNGDLKSKLKQENTQLVHR